MHNLSVYLISTIQFRCENENRVENLKKVPFLNSSVGTQGSQEGIRRLGRATFGMSQECSLRRIQVHKRPSAHGLK